MIVKCVCVVLVGFLGACSLLEPAIDRGVEHISKGVVHYCEEIAPQLRADFRQRVNTALNGRATVRVDCFEGVDDGGSITAIPLNGG